MPITLEPASDADVDELVTLRNEVASNLTERFGQGHWSSFVSEKSLRYSMRFGTLYVARDGGSLIATVSLAKRKPWSIDTSDFTACTRPLYLTSMAVAPDLQGKGVGASCIEEVRRIARAWPSDAVRLDAYDSQAGAGGFYRKCGFREVGRATYRTVPLVYFEWLA
jgi:GNAT superfamily N-acetyltransferase